MSPEPQAVALSQVGEGCLLPAGRALCPGLMGAFLNPSLDSTASPDCFCNWKMQFLCVFFLKNNHDVSTISSFSQSLSWTNPPVPAERKAARGPRGAFPLSLGTHPSSRPPTGRGRPWLLLSVIVDASLLSTSVCLLGAGGPAAPQEGCTGGPGWSHVTRVSCPLLPPRSEL